jgi:hypothetical protein
MPRTTAGRDASQLKIRRYRQVPGQYYGTPKELWNLSLPPQSGSPQQAAMAALRANAALLGLSPDLEGLSVRRLKHTVAGWHVIFEQKHHGIPIRRGYVTVHMDLRKAVYMIKNRAVPASLLPAAAETVVTAAEARRIATRSVKGRVLQTERAWVPVKARLRPAYKIRVRTTAPAEWLIYVDAINGRLLSKYDNLAHAARRAYVFNPNPVVALGDWRPLLSGRRPIRRVPTDAYELVTVRGVPRSGRLDGPHATTRGTKHRIALRQGTRAELSHEKGFEEVMAYYHVDQAIRYVRSLGYRGRREIFSHRLNINARATRTDQSTYSPWLRLLGFGTGHVDDAEDGETILHEFGHALQDAICPDFGQSPQAAAMGEGFGDYFAASFFASKKQRPEARQFIPAVMTWDGILFVDPRGASFPPCVRRIDGDATFEEFDHHESADEHDNGQIWSATLWEIWTALGRNVADRIIIESHFQLDAFTTFARGARAMIDADRNMYRGRHIARLKRIFRRRGIGPVD